MEREACVCDHGYERSDLCAEIIIIIICDDLYRTSSVIVKKSKRGACEQKAATVLPNRTAAA